LAAAPTRLMTFAEFEQLPDPAAGRYELLHGELILAPPPVFKHYAIQDRLRRLIEAAAGMEIGRAGTEFAFRPRGDADYYVCDVAWALNARWEEAAATRYFQGPPALVIEILSPSNTAAEMLEKEQVCLATGARQFWIVDGDRRQIKVSTPDGHTVTYRSGDQIPLFFAEGATLAVDAIFA
jgi:Uma2 family endonuclease